MNKTNLQNALVDMVKALKPVFKKYSRYARTEAWEKLSSKRGDDQMKKILIDPDRPINTFKQLGFKEWLQHENVIKTGRRLAVNEKGQHLTIPFKIYINPDKSEVLDAIDADRNIVETIWGPNNKKPLARGIINGLNIYVWPEHGAMHYNVANELGLRYYTSFYIDETMKTNVGVDSDEELEQLEKNPNFIKMTQGSKTTSSVVTGKTSSSWQDAIKAKPGKSLPLTPESRQP